jgi:transcriptional regulator with XRE-family HTH domain
MLRIGEIIRENREKRGLSQVKLAEGICEPTTLSRIENGKSNPRRATCSLLLERLGLSPAIIGSLSDEVDLKMIKLKHEINQHLLHERRSEAESLLDEMERIAKKDSVCLQHVEYVRAILLMKEQPGEALKALMKTAKKSISDISPQAIADQALTLDEINMLRNIAVCHWRVDEPDTAIEIMYELKGYIEKKAADDENTAATYTSILYTLSSWVGLQGDVKVALRLCEEGIKHCIEYGTYYSFSGLLYNKGYALVLLNRKKEARKYLQEAYYVYRARGRHVGYEHTKNYAKKHGIKL